MYLKDSTSNRARWFYELGIVAVFRLTGLGILCTVQGLCCGVLVSSGSRFCLLFLVLGEGPDGLEKLK